MSEASTFYYFAYGLQIRSEIALPELGRSDTDGTPEGREPDLDIVLRPMDQPMPTLDDTGAGIFITAEEIRYTLEYIGSFIIRGGNRVIVEPSPQVSEENLVLYVLGPVLGAALHQRGLLLLHGSAMSTRGSAVAFLGNSGKGKSTTAAALYARGYRLLTDDVVAIDYSGSMPMVLPAMPRIKLRPESAVAVGYDPGAMPAFHSEDRRRECAATEGYLRTPLPLCCIYVFDEDTPQRIERLSAQQAFLEVTRHAYPEFVTLLESACPEFLRFHHRARLVGQLPISSLKREFTLSALPGLIELIEKDMDQYLS